MISEKDYNEIYLKGYEDGKNDNNNLKIHYEIKPSFTTRKLKQLEQENKQLKEDRKFLFEENHNKEQVIIKQSKIIDKAIEYIEKLLKEEVEITDEDNIDYGMKCQKAYFSNSELIKVLEILKGEANE